MASLKSWIREAEQFLNLGSLSYIPQVQSVETNELFSFSSSSYWDGRASYPMPESFELRTFDAPHLGVPDGDLMLSDSTFAPLLNITLPALENIEYNDLYQIMADYPEQLCSFRDYLLNNLEAARTAAVGSEQFVKDCKRIERGIKAESRKLESDFARSDLKAALSAAGCVIASFTLFLYCIIHTAPDVLSILGPGGALYKISDIYMERKLRQLELRENQAYFLWILGKTETKK
ncbi:MAG: hypothetical protein JO119_08230 [Acidobacteria bacterium]|nr:hypothetical protein [Acidobacteriota bacterium]